MKTLRLYAAYNARMKRGLLCGKPTEHFEKAIPQLLLNAQQVCFCLDCLPSLAPLLVLSPRHFCLVFQEWSDVRPLWRNLRQDVKGFSGRRVVPLSQGGANRN